MIEEELNFENNKQVDFNFNKKSPYTVDKKIKLEFDLQYILDYLHKKEIVVFEGDAQKEIGDIYGVDLSDEKYYYVSQLKQPVLKVFEQMLYQELEKK